MDLLDKYASGNLQENQAEVIFKSIENFIKKVSEGHQCHIDIDVTHLSGDDASSVLSFLIDQNIPFKEERDDVYKIMSADVMREIQLRKILFSPDETTALVLITNFGTCDQDEQTLFIFDTGIYINEAKSQIKFIIERNELTEDYTFNTDKLFGNHRECVAENDKHTKLMLKKINRYKLGFEQ